MNFQGPTPEPWAHSEGHPHTERTFTGTLVNVGDLRRNSGECHGGFCEYGVVGSPKFAKVRQSSHEGARILLVHPGTCLRTFCQKCEDISEEIHATRNCGIRSRNQICSNPSMHKAQSNRSVLCMAQHCNLPSRVIGHGYTLSPHIISMNRGP